MVELRLSQHAADTALWSDEIALATAIVDLDLPTLVPSPCPASSPPWQTNENA